MAGETLGRPNSLRLPRPSLARLIVPIDSSCEFGNCGGGPIFGFADEGQDARIKALADGISQKGGALASPCFWAGWTAGATIVAGAGAAGASTVAAQTGTTSEVAPELANVTIATKNAVQASKTWAFIVGASRWLRPAGQTLRQYAGDALDWTQKKLNSVCDPRIY